VATPNWALAAKKRRLTERARILTEIRAFFVADNFLEVETPYHIPSNAPEPYIDPQPCGNWALHTSPELCMKRLLAAGYERIFQLCHCWRAEEHGSKHLPEFTMLEWYRSNCDYRQLMQDCENLLTVLAANKNITYQGQQIDITPPFEQLTLKQAFINYAPLSLQQAINNNCFEEIYDRHVEPKLGNTKPTIIYDFPVSMASLAQVKKGDPLHAERFELYVAGLELANAFSELTDPEEQRRRFNADEQQRRSAGKAPYPLPEPFLRELDNMPPSSGIALGIDRLVMLLTDADDIQQVVTFCPQDL